MLRSDPFASLFEEKDIREITINGILGRRRSHRCQKKP
jgi:hypothetical protein